jgi:type IV pilus assembly protein PilV
MTDRLHRPRDARGVTLIEVLVALLLFAVGMLALASLIPAGTKSVSKSGEQTRASELAAQTVEALLDTPYGDGDLTAGTHQHPGNPHPGSYYVSWMVEDDQPLASCKRITVYVRWPTSTSTRFVRLTGVSPESSWN